VQLLGTNTARLRFETREARALPVTIGLPDGTSSITVVESCRFKGAGGGGEKGNSALGRELPFSFMRIKRDGRYLVAGTR
jgi:hypothetical protein